MKTSREDKSYDKEDDKTLMSTEPNNKRMSFRVSTINFNITTDEKSYDTEKIYFA